MVSQFTGENKEYWFIFVSFLKRYITVSFNTLNSTHNSGFILKTRFRNWYSFCLQGRPNLMGPLQGTSANHWRVDAKFTQARYVTQLIL
jgi:hypothetical protein